MMKRVLRMLLTSTLLLALAASQIVAFAGATGARDARSLFEDMFGGDNPGQAQSSPVPESPALTPEPTLDAEFLFGDLFSNRTSEPGPEATLAPEATPSPEPEPEITPWPDADLKPSGSLFFESVREVTSQPWGGKVDFAYVGGWTINRGYFDGGYCLTGIAPLDAVRIVLADSDPMSFVPAGDSIVYYGEGTKGDWGWMLLTPGERRPMKMKLDVAAEVFYADDTNVWYYVSGKGESCTIWRMALDGSKKKKLGTVSGRVVTMMPDGRVLMVNFGKNRVQLWKDGKYETIYSPKQNIVSVVSTGIGIWVEHGDGYGLLEDGEIRFRLPGHIAGTAGSTDQFALLVLPEEDAEFFDVLMFNEIYRAYAEVGRVKRSDSTFIEFQKDQMIVWGPEESQIFAYPIPELWLPYGYHDFASAENFLSDEGWTQLLVGSWCAEPSVGSGYAERLIFTGDELYRLPGQNGKAGAKAKKSLWYVSDGLLLDYVGRDAPRLKWLAGPFTVPPEEAPYSPKISIDGVEYYQYSNDPAYFDDLKDYGVQIESSIGSPKTE